MRKIPYLSVCCIIFALAAACGRQDDSVHPVELAMLAREGKLPFPGTDAQGSEASQSSASGLSAAEIERQKALAQPYPNDLGPETVDISGYPKDVQEGYKIFQAECTVCHSAARPLNSQFLEAKGDTGEERKRALSSLKSSHPDLFAKENRLIWQPEADIWQRFVKRMRSKPGCDITEEEVKQIWRFMSYDSLARKTGPNKERWIKHRKQLVADFKKKHPARYKELFSN